MSVTPDNKLWRTVYERVPRLKEPEGRVSNYASNLWVLLSCPRRAYYDATRVSTGGEWDWELKAEHGNYLHEMIIDYFKKAGMWRGDEVRGSNEEYKVQYRIDLLVDDGSAVVPLEIKSANAGSMKIVGKEGPYFAHLVQLMVYMGFHGEGTGDIPYQYGYLLYYHKNDDRVEVYRVDFDEAMFDQIKGELWKHNQAVKFELTPGETAHNEKDCYKCPHKERCKAYDNEL